VELVGLEPTTSWVDTGMRVCVRGGRVGSRERNLARQVADRRSADSCGLPGITFDLGTGSGLVPIHLGRTLNFRVPVMGLGLCFSRLAGSEGVTAAFHRGVAARGTHARSEFVREQRVQGALSLSLCAGCDNGRIRRRRDSFTRRRFAIQAVESGG